MTYPVILLDDTKAWIPTYGVRIIRGLSAKEKKQNPDATLAFDFHQYTNPDDYWAETLYVKALVDVNSQ